MKIRGVNVGGWLLMEGYILGGRNISESQFKTRFQNVHGRSALAGFSELFRNNFIKKEDFKNIKRWGANCVRVPFNYKLIETSPFHYTRDGLSYLKRVLRWAKEYNLRIILDLHAACGSQNCDWHGDSSGRALLWEKSSHRERTYALWEYIVDALKDEPALLGYDVLNEPVVGRSQLRLLLDFYKRLVRSIRKHDREHTIFLEGNRWGQQIEFLQDALDDRVCVSIHTYEPINFTFNFRPLYTYPGKIDRTSWNRGRIYKYLEPYYKFAKKNKVGIFVGEFGVNSHLEPKSRTRYLNDLLRVFNDFSFGYTYWTYKAIAQGCFPDGIYQYLPDVKYVRRQGPVYGWENYPDVWPHDKYKLARFFRTSSYTLNSDIISILKKHFSRK